MTAPQTAPAPVEKRRRQAWWKRHVAVPVGRVFSQLLAASWRLSEHNTEAIVRLRAEGKPYIMAVWHGQLFVAVIANRFRNFCAMASTHGDADIMARMMLHWGYTFVRGSSSQGGREALLRMVEELQAGKNFAITPDGPRGPRGVPKVGTLVAAVRAGVPIVSMHCEVSSAWRFKSWDRFCIPKPFARVRVIYGDAWLPPDASEASLAELARLLGPAEAVDIGGERAPESAQLPR